MADPKKRLQMYEELQKTVADEAFILGTFEQTLVFARSKSIQDLVEYIDATHTDGDLADSLQSAISQRVRRFGIPLSTLDLETIARIRDAFVRDSLDLRYSSIGRAPRPYHPTYRQLLLEKDRSGRQANFLASEEAFQYVKGLEGRDLVVPVVGNAAGEHALGTAGAHPLNVAGHYSTQILQTLDAFVATYDSGAVRSYYDLISKNYVAP